MPAREPALHRQRRTRSEAAHVALTLGLSIALAAFSIIAPAAQGAPVGSVRGGAAPVANDELAPAERARIQAAIDTNISALQRAGRLPTVATRAAQQITFEWPLQLVPGHPEGVARTVTNFVDHNPAYPGQVQDYMCGTRTYDQANGYNHMGTDITSFPFSQRKQNYDEAIVVAAAPGVIILKEDGQPDHSCALSLSSWNAVYLQHADGSITWYGHLKANSLTTKQVGDSVDVGEFLGVMGSSGDSTGPHVHFEVYDGAGKLIDPFAGPCNNSTANSWWTNQRPYYESAIDLVMTGSAPVQFNACPAPDTENHSGYFQPGQTVYITAFLTDQLRADATVFTIHMPDGRPFASTTIQSNSDYLLNAFWEWSVPLPTTAPAGTWTVTVAFAGQTDGVDFQVGSVEPPRTSAVEYYSSALNHYFMTSFPREIAALDAGTPIAGWTRTGETFPTYTSANSDLATMCRFFGSPGHGNSTHFYTAFNSECDSLLDNPIWVFEADAFYIELPDDTPKCPPATRPVFRLYNNGLGGEPNHRYTTSWPIVNLMQSQGWLLEGVVMCTPL
jgi:murein DD-endopeptidase MepM/ murein hydrolase activator NlpD